MTQTERPPDDTEDLTEELTVALEDAQATIAHLVVLLKLAELYDDVLAADMIEKQRKTADVLNRAIAEVLRRALWRG